MNLQNPKFVLVAIAVLFFAPLLLALMMWSGWWGFEPARLTNHGILVQPPVELPVDALQSQVPGRPDLPSKNPPWTVLYTLAGECPAQCQQDVTGLRQIHIAAGRKRSSVAIWLLTPALIPLETHGKLVNIYPEFRIFVDTDGDATRILNSLSEEPGVDDAVQQGGQAFLLDPTSHIILRYKPGFDPQQINQDLDRLLTWSVKEL